MAKPLLVIACGALAREIHVLKKHNGWAHLHLTCLDAALHNRPQLIGARLRAKIREKRAAYESIFVAYADCGTRGEIDRICAEEGVSRLPGAHCYQFFAGEETFARFTDEEPGTFFLTDFLVRQFDRLVVEGLKLDRHPQLKATFFGNYHRLVWLAQTRDNTLREQARRAADYLGLEFHEHFCGYGGLATGLRAQAIGRDHGEENTRLLA